MDLRYGAASITQRGSNETIRYRELSIQEKRSGKCPTCGKRVNRQQTFTATVNPFNKDPETGLPRTPGQVTQYLRDKAAAWSPDFTHDACVTAEA